MLRLIVLISSSCLVVPLIIYLAVAADARAAGDDAPAGETIAAGIVIVILFLVAGLVVLVRPTGAALLFIFAGALGVLGGLDEGREGIAVYGPLSLLLATATVACSWRHLPTWLRDGRDS